MAPKKAPAVAATQGAPTGGAEALPATSAGNPVPPHSLVQAAIADTFTYAEVVTQAQANSNTLPQPEPMDQAAATMAGQESQQMQEEEGGDEGFPTPEQHQPHYAP